MSQLQQGSDKNVFLIDTNQFQGTESWSKIAKAKIHGIFPVKGVMIRASLGLTEDTHFTTNINGATQNGLYRGCYHTVMPQGTNHSALGTSARAQAQFFYDTVDKAQGWYGECLPPAIDIEANPSGLTASEYNYWLKYFLQHLETLLGKSWPLKPMLYLNLNTWQSILGQTTQFHTYPLWIAAWGTNQPTAFGGWTSWTMWQWSSPGGLSGITGNTDYDEWHTTSLPKPIPAPKNAPKASSTSSQPSLAQLLSAYQKAQQDLIDWALRQS